MDNLPTTSKHVRVDLLHPTFKARLSALLNTEPTVQGRAKIVSGVRSFADQLYFWNGYQNKLKGKAGYGHFNLAANPHRKFGGGSFQGSWHMQQPFDNYGHAVDIRLSGGLTWAKFVPIAKEYGVCQTVFRPQYEPWHYQWRNSNGIFQAPAMKGEKTETKTAKKQKVDLKGVAAALATLGEQVARRPLRRGSRSSAVKVIQERLASKGYKCGYPDGIFGRKTDRAVRTYQRANGLVVDGIVGRNTWNRLLK